MISDKHKFVFIHIPKTAGISIRKAIEPFCNNSEHYWNTNTHLKFSDFRNPKYNDYIFFTAIRNTYERLVSFGFYKKWGFSKQTLSHMLNEKNHDPACIFGSATNWFKPEDGMIIRVETLQEDFDKVCDAINIPRQALPVLNATKHKHYSTYYTDRMIELVQKNYADELDAFGYEFDDQRNV